MEGGALFNSGFLGASFSWWVGQIADDSTWRDNILPGKFETANQIPGWGRRYKVRIIGLHDQGETEIKSDQLPWAQVMYPVTAGGGQGGSGQTPNLRQGNMVFGFFLDGQEQQVPVIMGVLGNNAQTSLATKTGDGKVTNTQPGSLATSGFAEGQVPIAGPAKPTAPDTALVVSKPTPPGTPPATPKPGVKLDAFGRDPSRPPTRAELNAAQSARAEADRLGETGAVREARIANATVAATKQEAAAAASPASPAVPGATIENPDAIHLANNRDTKALDQYLKKTVMLSPCDPVGSAMKAMQTEIENLTKEIDKVLQTKNAYVDAVSEVTSKVSDITSQVTNAVGSISGAAGALGQVGGIGGALGQVQGAVGQVQGAVGQVGGIGGALGQVQGAVQGAVGQVQGAVGQVQGIAEGIGGIAGGIGGIGDIPGALGGIGDVAGQVDDTQEKIQALMEQYAPKVATHTKVIMDKIGEYTSKIFNAEIAPLADVMFPNQRFQFLDMKIEINETFKCLFSGITDGLSDSILGALTKALDKKSPSEDATPTSPGTAPFVPICSVEKLVGDVIATNLTDIEQTVEDALGSVGTFLDDIQAGLGELTGLISGIKIPDINASIASALSFENITLDIFGCDLKPNCAASDFYTLQEGGGAAEEAQLPSASGVAEEAAKGSELSEPTTTPFATPAKDTADLKIGETNNETQAAADAERQLAVQSLDLF
jgi:hypothetical protein